MHVRHHVHQFAILREGYIGRRTLQFGSFGGMAKCFGSVGADVLGETYFFYVAWFATVKPICIGFDRREEAVRRLQERVLRTQVN